jgi:predicted phosphodiesterase
LKFLVISDVHANIEALETVYEQEKDADRILCAGDILDYGTHPRETVSWVREHKVIMVAGNHDLKALEVFDGGKWRDRKPADYCWIDHTCESLGAEDFDYIRTLPPAYSFAADGVHYLMEHACKPNTYDLIESEGVFDSHWREKAGPLPPAGSVKRMIFGHTHRRCVHYLEDKKMWLNPGSISYRRPDDPDKDAHYAVIQDGHIFLKRIPYNRKVSLAVTEKFLKAKAMKEDELQVAFFFFGDAPTVRSPLPE